MKSIQGINIFLTLLSICMGCKTSTQEASRLSTDGCEYNVKINPSEADEIDPDDIFKIEKYIKLETTKECLFSHVKNVEIFNETIFVFAEISNSLTALLCFDMDGKFLFQIGSQGKGPKEYLALQDVSFDRKNKILYLMDFKKILVYKINGEFIKSEDLPGYSSEIASIEGDTTFYGKMGCYGEMCCFHITKAINGKILKEYFKVNPILRNGSPLPYKHLVKHHDNLYFLKEFCDTAIFKYVKGEFIPFIKVDFGINSFLMDKLSKKIETIDEYDKLTSFPVFQLKEEANKNNLVVDFISFYENDNLIIANYRFKRRYNSFAIIKESRKIFNIKRYSPTKVTFIGNGPYGSTQDNNEFINVIYPNILHEEKVDFQGTFSGHEKFQSIIRNTTFTDNPILVILTTKHLKTK